MNWSGILERAKGNINQPFTDADTDEGNWKNSLYLKVANDIMRDVCSITGCLSSESKFDVVSGQGEYEEKSDVNKVTAVYWYNGTDYVPLDKTSIEELDEYELKGWIGQPWRNESGNPEAWYPDAERGVIGTYPIASANLTDGFKKRYKEQPTEMTVGTSVPFNEEYNLYDYHWLIVYGLTIHFKLIEEENVTELKRTYDRGIRNLQRKCNQTLKPLTFSLESRKTQAKRHKAWPLGM